VLPDNFKLGAGVTANGCFPHSLDPMQKFTYAKADRAFWDVGWRRPRKPYGWGREFAAMRAAWLSSL